MFNRVSQFLYRRISIPIALGFTVIMILYASMVMGGQSECITKFLEPGQSLLGLQFGYDLDFVYKLFNKLDSDSLRCYSKLLMIWDNVFPLLYGAMYVSWLSIIYRKSVRIRQWPVNLYPVIPVVLDWIENVFENNLVTQYLSDATINPNTLEYASLVTQIKWSASGVNYLLILVGLVILWIGQFKRKQTKNNQRSPQ